jgi:hypothetical protein
MRIFRRWARTSGPQKIRFQIEPQWRPGKNRAWNSATFAAESDSSEFWVKPGAETGMPMGGRTGFSTAELPI